MQRGMAGRFEVTAVGGERVQAFVPAPLPPQPAVEMSAERQRLLEAALLACGRLDAITALLPEPDLFLYSYVRREAVLSSQIEGTQSSLSDLLLFELDEAPGVPFDDVVEVSTYVAALEHGLARLAKGFPLSNRLLREIHGVLLSRGRGANKQPGEFRSSQNWIGGTRPGNARFVPPPPQEVEPCMAALERFTPRARFPPIAAAALVKRRLPMCSSRPSILSWMATAGRALLISLLLHHDGILRQPLLYLSLYFKQHRAEYYRQLDAVRTTGDWEAWLEFFLEGVAETAGGAVDTAHRLLSHVPERRHTRRGTGPAVGECPAGVRRLRRRPVADIDDLARETGIAYSTAARAVEALVGLDVLRELTGRQRGRVFAYSRYLEILSEGAQPL